MKWLVKTIYLESEEKNHYLPQSSERIKLKNMY